MFHQATGDWGMCLVGWIVFLSREWYTAMGTWAYLRAAGNN